MGKKNNRDYSYHLTVSDLTAEEADNLSNACRRAKREHAGNGRASSFTGKTENLGRHLRNSKYGYIEGNNKD